MACESTPTLAPGLGWALNSARLQGGDKHRIFLGQGKIVIAE